MCGGKGVLPRALHICASCAFAKLRCASGERDTVRDLPKHPPEMDSSLVEGAYRAARESGVSEYGSKCVIPFPLTWNGLECVDVRRDLTFGNIQVYARPRAELLDYT